MFEREDQSPEVVNNNYAGLPEGVLTLHDQWSSAALYIGAQVPALSNKECEDIQRVASTARGLSLRHLHDLPKVADQVLEVHKHSLSYKAATTYDVKPDDFARGAFVFDETGDPNRYNFGAALPNFETFFGEIWASSGGHPDIDRGVLRREYDKVLETAAGAFAEAAYRSFIKRFDNLDQLEPKDVAQAVLPRIVKKQNEFIGTRLRLIAEAAEVLPEQTRTQRVLHSIGRVATGGLAYAEQAKQRKKLSTIITKDLIANKQYFGVHTEAAVQSWLLEKKEGHDAGYLLDNYAEFEELQDLYSINAGAAARDLDAIKKQYAPLPQAYSEQQPAPPIYLKIPGEFMVSEKDFTGKEFSSPREFTELLTQEGMAQDLRTLKKTFRRLVTGLGLHPDNNADESKQEYLKALTQWYDEAEHKLLRNIP